MPRRFTSRLTLAVLAAAAFAASAPLAIAQPAPSYTVVDRIKGPDAGFDYASFDPAHRRVYVSRSGGVLALDVDTGVVTGHLTDAQKTHESLPLDNGDKLLITDSGTNTAHLVEALTGKPLAEIPTGQKPDGAFFDPATDLAFVIDGKSGDVTLVDPSTQKAVGSIAIGGGLEFGVADGQGRAFVNIEDQNQIAVLDTKARTLVGRYPLAGCEGPTGLAYVADAGVLIAACANKAAKIIRAADGKDLGTLTIGAGPDAVIYDASRRLAFIPCGRDGVLEVIAVQGPDDVRIVQTVATEVGAKTGALDTKTGRLYLPTARYTIPADGGRPVSAPGSFEILVVAPNG
jgi:DNA-binding beta-propeller fold protein YncE